MSEPFELEDAKEAERFLSSLPKAVRRKGEEYFRQGRVGQLVAHQPGEHYSVKVTGSQLYEIELDYDSDIGWSGECTCPLFGNCKHVYAAMKALLAEHSAARVRHLSAGTIAVPPRRKSENASLSEVLEAALKRPLTKQEAAFVKKVSDLYLRSRGRGAILVGDFEDLGLYIGGYLWDRLSIWPSFPNNEHEFWLYIAHTLRERKRPIPPFMAPITDLQIIEDRLEKWRRSQEIERWRNALETASIEQQRHPLVPTEIDLRLKLSAHEASLEWRRFGKPEFEPMKQNAYWQLAQDYNSGSVRLTAAGELIWHSFNHGPTGVGPVFRCRDHPEKMTLSRMLRHDSLRDAIVTSDGKPFERVREPLKWSMSQEPDAAGNYQVCLLLPDGSPVDDSFLVLPGIPALYISRDRIFEGPPGDTPLKAGQKNLIPAPVIESAVGIEFLSTTGVDLPAPLARRIRHEELRVVIQCELQENYRGAPTEVCKISVTACADGGQPKEMWNRGEWQRVEAPATSRVKEVKNQTVTLYNRSALLAVPAVLQPLDLKWDSYQQVYTLRVTKRFPEIFVPWLKSLPSDFEVRLEGELASLASDPVAGQVKLEVTETELDWFDLRVVLDVSDTELSPDELKLLLNAKGRYVRLGRKGWRRLQFNLTEDEDERLAQLGLNPHELNAEPQRLHALQLANEGAKKFLPEQQVAAIHRRANEIKVRLTPEVPKDVRAELRPYQREGFHFLAYLSANRFGGILADDMGLGKTVQALTWLMWLRGEQKTTPGPSLVVCPKSVMDNWRAEAERFTTGLRVRVWRPSELESFLSDIGSADLHVLNYSQLRGLGESLVTLSWLAVILDEGQYIKNPNSQTAQIARALRADQRLVLSGTPIENRLLDLWSLMAFAMPGILGSRSHFARLFDNKADRFARRRLAARVRPFLLRRTKTQVAKDLPDRVEEDLFCEIEGEQQTLYRAELKRAQQLLLRVQTQKQLAKERFHFLTSLLRLRQICCHPALVKVDSTAESAKVQALIEQVEPLMEEGHKVLVFSQFVTLLDLLRPVIVARQWPHFYLTGDSENRGEIVSQFQSAEGGAVFLISLKAGGFGLNLTAASYVVLFDPWWNPAVENQAIDRTHRIGQTNKVMAYRLLIKDSIEEKIRTLQKRKSALAQDILGEEKFAQSLTLDDLQFLFAD